MAARQGNIVDRLPQHIDIDYHILKPIRKQLPKGLKFKSKEITLFLEHCKDYILFLNMNDMLTNAEMDELVARLHKRVVENLTYDWNAADALGLIKRDKNPNRPKTRIRLTSQAINKPKYG